MDVRGVSLALQLFERALNLGRPIRHRAVGEHRSVGLDHRQRPAKLVNHEA